MNYSLSNMLGGGFVGGLDPDASAYIAAVEAADGQALEPAIRLAYDRFVRGCKSDTFAITGGDVVAGSTFRNWDRLKASCILAGARTFSGALVPLVGSAPTNNNFVSGDYNRKTGLVGNGTTKFLNSNRNNDADPQDDNHNAVWASTIGTGTAMASNTTLNGANLFGLLGRKSRNLTSLLGITMQAGFSGTGRSNSSNFNYRTGGTDNLSVQVSQSPSATSVMVFGDGVALFGNHRLAFYSIGEALDLAALDARVATLTAAISAALP
jgi:hypothetical protein